MVQITLEWPINFDEDGDHVGYVLLTKSMSLAYLPPVGTRFVFERTGYDTRVIEITQTIDHNDTPLPVVLTIASWSTFVHTENTEDTYDLNTQINSARSFMVRALERGWTVDDHDLEHKYLQLLMLDPALFNAST